MLIHVEVSPASGSTVSDLNVAHFTKAQMDDDYNSLGDSSSDDRFVAAIGTESGWSFGYGICNSERETVGTIVSWATSAEPDMCLPGDDYDEQYVFGYSRTADEGWGSSMRMGAQSVSMVISTGTTSIEAEEGYEDWREDLCGTAYVSGSPEDLDTCR